MTNEHTINDTYTHAADALAGTLTRGTARPAADPLDEAEQLNDLIHQLDEFRALVVKRRADVVRGGLDDGLLSRDFSERLNVSSTRVFAMIRQGRQ